MNKVCNCWILGNVNIGFYFCLNVSFLSIDTGLNCELYYKNKDFRKNVSLVPTSAITGEGIPDLLMLITQLSQQMMGEKLAYLSDLQCTVLEVLDNACIAYAIYIRYNNRNILFIRLKSLMDLATQWM